MRAAIYARVSTWDQEPENQLAELPPSRSAWCQAGVNYRKADSINVYRVIFDNPGA